MKRTVLITLSAIAFLALAAGLLSGGDWLVMETWAFGIPAGNLVAWGLLFAWSVLAWTCATGPRIRAIALVMLMLAAAWLPISIALFGNVNLNNASPGAYEAWVFYTGLLAIAPPVLLLAMVVKRVWTALRA